jgi:hypothetical protein
MPFKTFGLSDPLVQGILATGYTAPAEIQSQVIPAGIISAVSCDVNGLRMPDGGRRTDEGGERTPNIERPTSNVETLPRG